jgi:hypothetical protein
MPGLAHAAAVTGTVLTALRDDSPRAAFFVPPTVTHGTRISHFWAERTSFVTVHSKHHIRDEDNGRLRTIQPKNLEMIMSYAAYHRDFGSFVSQASKAVPKRAGILRRIFDAFMASRQRDVDRQITRFLAARSARTVTDDLEREISHRLSTSNWNLSANPYGDRRFP